MNAIDLSAYVGLVAVGLVTVNLAIGFLIAAERSYQHNFSTPDFAQSYRLS